MDSNFTFPTLYNIFVHFLSLPFRTLSDDLKFSKYSAPTFPFKIIPRQLLL